MFPRGSATVENTAPWVLVVMSDITDKGSTAFSACDSSAQQRRLWAEGACAVGHTKRPPPPRPPSSCFLGSAGAPEGTQDELCQSHSCQCLLSGGHSVGGTAVEHKGTLPAHGPSPPA